MVLHPIERHKMDHRDTIALSVLSSAGYGQDRLQTLDEDARDKLAALAAGTGDRRSIIQRILAAAQQEVVEPIQTPEVKLFNDGE